MVNNSPIEPLTDSIVEPELYKLVKPVTLNDPVISADPVYGNVVAGTLVNPDPSP